MHAYTHVFVSASSCETFWGLFYLMQHRGLVADGFQVLLQRCHLEIPASSCNTIIDRGGARGLASFQDGTVLTFWL